MAATLTDKAQLQCPHGGAVQITVAQQRVAADNGQAVRATDTFAISGCGFTLPNGSPSPCVRVDWSVTDARVTVQGDATLSEASTGLCYSGNDLLQGPVTILRTQEKVATQ